MLALAAMGVQAQNCPTIDAEEQKVKELACRTAGGEWARWGVRDHICGVYSCVERTTDAGTPCRNRADCQHLCVTDRPPLLGAEAVGRCTAVKSNFGCFTHVDGGQIVGRVCLD